MWNGKHNPRIDLKTLINGLLNAKGCKHHFDGYFIFDVTPLVLQPF